jgi:class 3 adenylate cyclase
MDVPKTRWATTVDGACIAYQELGEGPVTLVVIPAWFSHLEVYWEEPHYARFMRRLARNMRVITFDKRGVGMSDRVHGALGLEAQMDDVRAVMDSAGVGRAALLGWGGFASVPPAVFFAATYPDRALALCIDGPVHPRKCADFPWGPSDEEEEEWLRSLATTWGDDDRASDFAMQCFGEEPADAPTNDPRFLTWLCRMARFSATPVSIEAFERIWFATDIRGILAGIHVPTLVLGNADDDDDDRAAKEYAVAHIPGARLVYLPGSDYPVWITDPDNYVAAIEDFIDSVRHEEAELDRVLATVLFTDVVGSTQKATELGDARWKGLLERQNAAVRAMLARYRGNEVKTMGDGFLATFDGPARAVKCARGICEAVKPLGLEVRAGCHTGEIELMGADVGGIAVHIGARVGALAGPSEVLVSSTVKDLVAGSGLAFEDRGEHTLKGVPDPWHLYAVTA